MRMAKMIAALATAASRIGGTTSPTR